MGVGEGGQIRCIMGDVQVAYAWNCFKECRNTNFCLDHSNRENSTTFVYLSDLPLLSDIL